MMDSEPNLPYQKKRRVTEDKTIKAQKDLIRRKKREASQIYTFPVDDGKNGKKF